MGHEIIMTIWTYIKIVSIAAFAFIAPIQGVVGTVISLLFIDMVTAVLVAHKTKQKVTAEGLMHTVSKSFLYFLAILAAFLIEYNIPGVLPLAKLVGSIISLAEATSIYTNLSLLTGLDFKALLGYITPSQPPQQEKKGVSHENE